MGRKSKEWNENRKKTHKSNFQNNVSLQLSTTSQTPSTSSNNNVNLIEERELSSGELKRFQRQQEAKRKAKEAKEVEEKKRKIEKEMGPLHNPTDQNWFNEDHKPLIFGTQQTIAGKVQVVVDPRISLELQKHQRDGISKMYNYLSKAISLGETRGFILADGMGLGKTLQAITILWTFLTQSSEWDAEKKKVKPLIKKAIVVSPANVIHVWKDQINKWLLPQSRGKSHINSQMEIVVIDDKVNAKMKKELVEQFMTEEDPQNKPKQCLILSYESFVKLQENYQINNDINDDLRAGPLQENWDDLVGLLILDEAHYIKNMSRKRTKALSNFKVQMKIALTGTPIQNNLEEYYSILSFVKPDFESKYPIQDFKTDFIIPIYNFIRDKSDEEGAKANTDLRNLVRPFFLRRTTNPFVETDKTEYIVCCKMSTAHYNISQLQLYNDFVDSYTSQFIIPQSLDETVDDGDGDGNGDGAVVKSQSGRKRKPKATIYVSAFQAISYLKFLCSHPALIENHLEDWEIQGTPGFESLKKIYNQEAVNYFDETMSSKMFCLTSLIAAIREDDLTCKDRIVIVSYYTTVLGQIEEILKKEKYHCVKYEGGQGNTKRTKILKKFNDPAERDQFILLLSSKAGGCGISLTGANHLIMFDPDWNPANDEQAMARIYRDGQKKHCHIYRLLTAGSIEEEQFKRQIFKKILAGQVLSDGGAVGIYGTVDNPQTNGTSSGISPSTSSASSSSSGKKKKNRESSKSTNGNGDPSSEEFSYLKEKINTDTLSLTHDDLKCEKCSKDDDDELQVELPNGNGESPQYKSKDELDLASWNHVYNNETLTTEFCTLRRAWGACDDKISMVFQRTSKGNPGKRQEISSVGDEIGENEEEEDGWKEEFQ